MVVVRLGNNGADLLPLTFDPNRYVTLRVGHCIAIGDHDRYVFCRVAPTHTTGIRLRLRWETNTNKTILFLKEANDGPVRPLAARLTARLLPPKYPSKLLHLGD